MSELAIVLVEIQLMPEERFRRRSQLALVNAEDKNESVNIEEVLDGFQNLDGVGRTTAIELINGYHNPLCQNG